MQIKTNRKSGFTLVEIMIVVAIIGLLASIAIPNFVKARSTAQKNACINNLRQIEGAKDQWALENGRKTGDATASDSAAIDAYLKASPTCPTSGTYTYGAVGTSASCSNSADGHVL
jgi:prepilin-type N-terminal cleavage/methylation domain-containing protein